MKIAIDCRELHGPSGGFKTYLLGLLTGLAAVDTTNSYLLYAYSTKDLEGLRVPTNSVLRTVSGGRLWSDWFAMRKLIGRDQPDVVHFPANYGLTGLGVPTVITLHDCISLTSCAGCTSVKSELLKRYSAIMTRRSIPHANVILTVSNYSRDQIIRRFGCSERIVVTYEAAREATAYYSSEAHSEPYLLALASVDRRKNTAAVIEAFSLSRLPSEGYRLVIVASNNRAGRMIEQQAIRFGVQAYTTVLVGIDDSALRQLYKNSAAFVFPSLDEGFGLPPLEAMACGTVVISSDRASMPEILGDAALYFDPEDKTDLARKMEMMVTNKDLAKRLREAGVRRAAKFSWEKTACGTLYAYK
ncbi:MAG: glycosyltransferase family 4 protein, partial [Armatimonadetes bacterium]|nr:glycosyltransferase family 4 protein [Armatimonadota bacterium]